MQFYYQHIIVNLQSTTKVLMDESTIPYTNIIRNQCKVSLSLIHDSVIKHYYFIHKIDILFYQKFFHIFEASVVAVAGKSVRLLK